MLGEAFPFDVCAVGHITRDVLRQPTGATLTRPGGAAYYAAAACRALGLATCVVTRMAAEDVALLQALTAAGVVVRRGGSRATTTFETNCGEDGPGAATPTAVADPFVAADLAGIRARAFVLDPLVDEDLGAFLSAARSTGALVALDVQGLVRKLSFATAIDQARRAALDAFAAVDVLKAEQGEAAALTGVGEPLAAAAALARLGAREVIVTLGEGGAVVVGGGGAAAIPAFAPKAVVDATGCGDSFLAAYVARRLEGAGPAESAKFAAALAALKIEHHGPFTGSRDEVEQRLKEGRTIPSARA
jgi:sugar/nucleoside kinase (ribokinase family)